MAAKVFSLDSIAKSALIKRYHNLRVGKPDTGFPNQLHSVCRRFTLAEVTAMHTVPVTLVSDLKNLTVRPVNIIIRASGTFDGFTNLVVEDTNGTPVAVGTLTLIGVNAGLAVVGTAALTLGAGFGNAGVTAGKGLQIKTSGGTAATTGTFIEVLLQYDVIE